MQAQSADPREDGWHGEPIGYRVDFWRPMGNVEPRPLHIGVMFEASEWLLTHIRDVAEAIEWADANADGRTYTLYAVYERGSERGLILLRGLDPTRSRIGWEHQEEVARLFATHGYEGEIKMKPVIEAGERVFVLAPSDLAALSTPDELIASLEQYLSAPVRLVPS